MKSQEAQRLIKQTFENPFNKTQFIHFINNLLKDEYEEKSFIQTGAHLPDAFSTYIRKMERIGKYEDATGNFIDILMVELKRDHSIEYARTAQRNFIRRYLNGSRGGELKDAAIVAFFTEGAEDWRFSLIKMQYSLEKKKDELTPAKRFSFLVGTNEKSHTAQKQLAGLLTMDKLPVLTDIESAFNIETVTREFFEKYKELFLHVSGFFEKQFEKNRALRNELTAKNIDHISFTKKLLGQIVFLYFLQKKGWLGVDKNGKWGEGDKRFLRSLLEKATAAKKNFYTDYLQYLFYEALAEERRNTADPSYYRLFDCKIPFLNGGLFEADYDWKNITVKIPNDFFTNENITKEGDTGDGILDVFDRYNFTVKEDEPLDKEVAVDPEMLGKVFEKLLEVKDRKSKGAFYTPREIVHYMCQESLINYLDTTLNNEPAVYQKLGTAQTDMFGNKARKGQLALEAKHGETVKVPKPDLEKFIREGNSAIDNDARVEKAGRETVAYSYHLPESIRTYAADIDKALADIRVCDPAIGSGAFPVGIMNEIVKAREILTTYLPLKKQKERTAYEFKRHCIQESVYGVDIDHSAIDIAKLRLWLSLVVDEQDLSTVKPLPNLDYKIVCGNSLIGYPFEPKGLELIEKLKIEFISLTDYRSKIEYRSKINTAINNLLKNTERTLGYNVDFDFKIHFSEVFHEKKGFDVVIGNPPYVYRNLNYEGLKKYFASAYKSCEGNFDLYKFFIEKAITIVNSKGHSCLIIPNTFLTAKSYNKLRKFVVENCSVIEIFDLGENLFEGVTVENVILQLHRERLEQYKSAIKIQRDRNKPFSELDTSYELDLNEIYEVEKTFNIYLNFKTNTFIKKIRENTFELSNIAYCTVGINTGYIKDELTSERKLDKTYHKMLSGRDIGINSISWKGIWIKYDKEFVDSFGDRGRSLPPEYVFKDEKILVQRTRRGLKRKLVCYYDDEKYYNLNRLSNIVSTSDDFFLKYVHSLLNSSLMDYYFNVLFNEYEVKPVHLAKLPIKDIPAKNQKPFINLVDKILEAKKLDPTANTTRWEKQIDIMVYHLYNLTYDEAKIIDPELSEEEFAKYKL